MAGFDFPTNPPLGTITTTPDGAARSWDGVKWSSANGGPFLPLTGGTMKGPINLAAPPVSPAQAASKAYVDSLVGTGGGSTTQYRIIDLAGILGVDPSSGADATAAMHTALTMAASSSGSIIDLCPGEWNFQAATPAGASDGGTLGACFLIPSRTVIRGAGLAVTRMLWNDADETFNLFDAVPNASELTFQDFTIVGSWDRNLEGTGNGGYPLIIHNASAIRFHRVGSRFCRRNAIVTRYCYDIVCHECDIRYCAHGAIDHATCAMVIVSNNTIMHSDDNCIAVHSENFDSWGVRKNVIIVGNSIFDSVGIACIAPRSVLVAYNNLDCIRLVGITFHEYVPPTVGSNSAALGTVIANNNITNIINEWAFSGPPQIRNGNIGISLSGSSARAGNLPAIPGENVTNTTTVDGIVFPAGTIIDDTVYFGTNSTDPTVAVAISRGYTIIGNSVARTLPPCDGTATAVVGGTTKTYTKWSDYGFTDPVGNGWMFLKTGWVNPSLNVSQISGEGVRLGGGSIRDVLITNNEFRGLEKAVNFYLCQPKDVFVRSNLIVDCGTGFGAIVVDLSPTSGSPPVPDDPKLPARIYIEDNFIDVDPYQRHSNRLPRGQWNTNARPQWPGAVWIQSGSGVVFRRNTVRNANVVVSNGPGGVTHVSDNWVEGFPAPIPNTPNAGIGVVPLDGTRLRHIESDPTSTHYGEIMSAPLDVSLSMPTTGLYLVGAYVTRTYTGLDANGAVLRGWVRLTTGATHVAGVDWTPVYDYATSNDLTALPVVGASNGIVTSVVVNPQPGAFQFAISDPWPGVAIDARRVAAARRRRCMCRHLLPEIPGTIDTTTMGSDHNLGLVPLIAAGGLSYVVGETLTATGGTFTTPFQGTVDSIGPAGGVQRFIVTQGGTYSAFPPDPTNFSGTAGAGFALHLQTWALGAPLIVDNGGHYPNGTPNAVLTFTNGNRGGRLTVKMGQSFVGSPTGLMLAGNATAPLQAVPLQQLTSATAGGPFLPLTGGTVAGATTFSAGLTAAVAHTIGSGANNILTVTPGSTTAANVTYVSTAGAPAGHQFGASSGNPIVIKPQATASSTSNIVALGTGSLGLGSGGTSPVLVGASGTGAIQAQQFTTANFSTVLSGATIPPPPGIFTTTVSGTSTATGVNPIGLGLKLGGSTDNAAIPHGAHYLEITQVVTGAAYDGTRIGILSNQNVSTNTTFSSAASGLIGAYLTVAGSANVGGATGFGNAKGQLFGADFTVALNTGATNWLGATGVEIDVLVNSGASVGATTGLQIVHLTGHGKQANLVDAALMIGDQTGVTAGWKHGFLIGTGQSLWPIDTSAGYLFQAVGSSGFVAAAAGGIDVQHVSFTGTTGPLGSGFAFRADGVQLLPDTAGSGGAVQAGSGVLQGTATGASLDTSAKQMTGTPTISAGGAGYSVGDTCADTNGNVIKVNTVSSGAVTAFTVVRRGWSSAATPPATGTFPAISVAGGTLGSGLVLNLTWTAQTTLALQPSGGPITLPGVRVSTTYANDAAAATGGVAIGQLYRNGSVIQIRVA